MFVKTKSDIAMAGKWIATEELAKMLSYIWKRQGKWRFKIELFTNNQYDVENALKVYKYICNLLTILLGWWHDHNLSCHHVTFVIWTAWISIKYSWGQAPNYIRPNDKMSHTDLQIHITPTGYHTAPSPPKSLFHNKPQWVVAQCCWSRKRRVLCHKTVQSLLYDKKMLYNLRNQDAFHDISSFQKVARCHCIVLSLCDGSK